MRGGRSKAHRIEKSTAADDDNVRMAIEMRGIDEPPHFAHQGIVGLDLLPTGQDRKVGNFKSDRPHALPRSGLQARPGPRHRILDQDQPALFTRGIGKQIRQILQPSAKGIARENDTVLEGQGNLEIVPGHQRAPPLDCLGILRQCFFHQSTPCPPPRNFTKPAG